MKINKILIANRGEIACRIMQSCKQMGIKTLAIHAEIERNARHVEMADEAFVITAEDPTSAYLDIESIIKIASENQVDAIHPGYGFLSERAEFAKAIDDAGLIFIGAPIAALELMGSKAAAKASMQKAGVPCVPGYHGDNQEDVFLKSEADITGYPLLIKASAGGGGKGMKIVNQPEDFLEALHSAKREAIKSFGNDHVILERFITRPKHIEVQVFADTHGNVVHLFERDCSTQRRYQKIIEEAPATCIKPETKQAMYDAALAATKAVNYCGAGTIEFIVEDDEFFFMEMNTRLQVEHRVTEMITGTDLVEWQIRVASGDTLPLKQEEIECNGHAIQARIYAEDSFNNFLPATGMLEQVVFPEYENTIVDTGIRKTDNISIHFDPMIAKIVCWQEDRDKCISRTLDVLDNSFIAGVKTNLPFLSSIMASKEFSDNSIYTNSLDNTSIQVNIPDLNQRITATLAHKVYFQNNENIWSDTQNWSNSGRYFNNCKWSYHEQELDFNCMFTDSSVLFDNGTEVDILADSHIFESENQVHLIHNHLRYIFDNINHGTTAAAINEGDIISPMPGKILQIRVKQGDVVEAGQTLVVMEAMKMELTLKAGTNSEVHEIHVSPDDVIQADTLLVSLS